MNVKKSKIKIVTLVIILTVITFGLIIPNIVNATGFWGDLGKDILSTVGEAIQFILNWLLKAAAGFFEGMLGIGFKNTLNTIKIGWTACRDFANMFFILFMVVIAFGTILRIEQYGIKKLLPKVIGIALLINFSMVFCSVIIDFSNLTADFFIKDIKGKISKADGTAGALTATFADAFNITGVYVTFTNCDDLKKLGEAECDKYSWFWTPTNLAICKATWQKKSDDCLKSGSATLKTGEGVDFLNLFLGYTVGSIIMLIAVFTLFAGGIMLLFRIIAIWFLVTISPLVFICYIMPGLKNNWQKWWKTFLNWCIFAPAYAFFIWMAIQIAVAGANKQMGLEANGDTLSGNYNAMANSFVNSPGQQLISYFIIIGFLVGGLIVAKTLGIYGANTVMSLAQKAQKGATNWAKRATMRPVTAGSKIAGAGALGFGGRLFKGTKLGGRMDAKATQISQSRIESDENKKYAALLKTMSKDALLKEVQTAQGARKLIATKEAAAKGFLTKADKTTVSSAIKTYQGYGMKKEADDLQSQRADSQDDATMQSKLDDMKKDGELGNLSVTAFEDPRVLAYLAKICKAEELDAIRNKSPRYKTAIDGSATSTTGLYALAHDPGRAGNINIQHAYAAASGNIENLAGLNAGDRKAFANTYAKPEQLKRIKINAGSFGGNGDMQADLISGMSPGTLGTFLTSADKDTAFYTVRFIKANRNNATHPEINALYRVIASDPKLDALG